MLQVRRLPGLFCFLVRLRGFEPMRWNSVKKTAQWAVFRNSPEGFSLRVRGARSAARNPLQATTISKARSDERAFLLPLRDALATHFCHRFCLLTPLSACFPQKLFHILIALVPFASTAFSRDFIDVFLAFSRLGSCFESQQKNGLRSFIS